MPVRDDSLIAQYIRAIENPDSIGFNKGRWEQSNLKGHDSNNRGFGIDVIYNDQAHALTNNRKGRWLSEEEERKLRKDHTDYIEDKFNKWMATPYILRQAPTEEKKAMALGMLYRGDGVGSIINNTSIRDAYYSGSNEDMQKAVSDYYKRKNISRRAELHNKFFNKGNDASKNNIPTMIKRPDKWSPSKFSDNSFTPKNKLFSDGGNLNDNYWDNLSMADKAEMIRVAVSNGMTTLPEIRSAYNEFAKGGKLNSWTMRDEAGYRAWRSRLPKNLRDTNNDDYDMRAAYKAGMKPEWNNEDKAYHLGSRDPKSGRILKAPNHPTFLKALITDSSLGYYPTTDANGNTYTNTWKANEFANGGYAPSAKIKKDISNWEGSSMKTNRSFEAEAKDFNRIVPAEIRSKLSSQQLDALYSYGYNVGMNNLKKRVVPILTAYTEGKASKEDVQRSMWASRDNELRGLTDRRNWERGLFGGNYRTTFTGKGGTLVGSHINPNDFTISQESFDNINSMINNVNIPQLESSTLINTDPTAFYKAPVIDDTLFENPKSTPIYEPYNPQQERQQGLQNFSKVMGLLGQENPYIGLVGGDTSNLFSYINQIYNS